MKLKSLFILSLVVFFFFSWKFIDNNNVADLSGHQSIPIRMREIGHQLLLNSGDTSSRVLPVASLKNNTFLIKFESQFALVPDTLIQIVHEGMQSSNLPSQYIVNVLQCGTFEVVYGFEIIGDKDKDVVPCLGRSLPKQCYEIRVSFPHNTPTPSKYVYPASSMMFCLFLAFLVFRKNETYEKLNDQGRQFIQLGQIKFLYEKRVLKVGKNSIELTTKENQVLKILASNLNETLSREKLQKEVWEDEGVLVGRSLDVFISKLRKKLEADPDIRIVNIHGKGYKLELN
ncbi:MAG: hypothetical protein ACI9GZ_001448 [Bacteroidia bacterium]|jgi:hypothetical protein